MTAMQTKISNGGEHDPRDFESAEAFSTKLRNDIKIKFPDVKIIENTPSNVDEKGLRSNTFFVEYPIGDSWLHLRSVIKTPNDNIGQGIGTPTSVQSIHNEAAIYEFLQNRSKHIPAFLGFNQNVEILHLGYIYTNEEDPKVLLTNDPLEATVSAMEAVQELHKLGVVHRDLFIYDNLIFWRDFKGALNTTIIDLGSAESFPNPKIDKLFDKYRIEDIGDIFLMLTSATLVNNPNMSYKDKDLILKLEDYGIEKQTCEKLFQTTEFPKKFIPTLGELDMLIAELKDVVNHRKNKGFNKQFISIEDIQNGDQYNGARDQMQEVHRFLMGY